MLYIPMRSKKSTGTRRLKINGLMKAAIGFFVCMMLIVPVWGDGPAAGEKAAKDKKVEAPEKETPKETEKKTPNKTKDEAPAGTERTLSRESFEKLPRGKGLESILPLLPGITWDAQPGQPSIDGATGPENRYFVEGVDTTTFMTGEQGLRVHTDFIETLKVPPYGADASMGGFTGGAVEVILREGGNQFHGSVGLYYEGSGLQGKSRPTLGLTWNDEAEYLTNPRDSRDHFEPVFTLGGPIIKNRLWFFGGFSPAFTTIKRDISTWPRRGGNIFPLAEPAAGPQNFSRSETRYNGALKLTGILSDRLRVSAAAALDIYRWKGELLGLYEYNDPFQDDAAHAFRFPAVSFSTGIEYAVSGGLRVRADLGYVARDQRESGTPEEPILWHMNTTVNVPGITDDLVVPAGWRNRRLQALVVEKNLETSLSAGIHLEGDLRLGGAHAVKAGFRVIRDGIDKKVGLGKDFYLFYWGDDASVGGGGVHRTTLGYVKVYDPRGYYYDIHTDRFQVHVEDTWTRGRFSLTLGLRAQQYDIPGFNEEFYSGVRFEFSDTLAPRAAFNWSPLQDGTLRVSGSFSITYDTPKLDWGERYFGGYGWTAYYYDIVDSNWKDAYHETGHPQENGLAGGEYFGTRDFNIYGYPTEAQPDLKPMGKRAFTLGVRKDIGRDWTASALFLHHALFNAVHDTGVHMGNGDWATLIVNPGSDWLQQKYEEAAARGHMPGGVEAVEAKRTYTAVTLRLDKKFSHRWLGGLSYTWSRLHGNYDGLRRTGYTSMNNSSPYLYEHFYSWYLPYTQTQERIDGPLSLDRTHRFKIYGAYTFDFGLTLGFHGYGMSGTPVQKTILLNGNQVLYPQGRGSEGRLPFLWQLDIYAQYDLQLGNRLTLQLSADITNATNNDTPGQKHMVYNGINVYVSSQSILKGIDYDRYISEKNVELDPRYGMEYNYMDAIAARLGVKLMF